MSESGLSLFTIFCALACVSACGSGPSQSTGEVVSSRIVVQDTVISTASELIGGAIDMVVGPDNRLYIADYQSNWILSIRPDGTDPKTFGREGSAPGEFRTPWALAVSSDSIWVYDMGNARVQTLDITGAYSSQYSLKIPQLGGGRVLNNRGALAAATGGRDSALVVVVRGQRPSASPWATLLLRQLRSSTSAVFVRGFYVERFQRNIGMTCFRCGVRTSRSSLRSTPNRRSVAMI